MMLMFGDTRASRMVSAIEREGHSRMVMEKPKPFPYEKYGFDNKAFKTWQDVGFPVGLTIDDWCILYDFDDYLERLESVVNCGHDPYMAVCPDIPAGGLQSLEYSVTVMEEMPRSLPWYFAVQDGMREQDVEPILHLYSGIFLGGSDKFKSTAFTWAKLAHKHQKKFHYGRASTLNKLKSAFLVESDSADTAFACWTYERFNEYIRYHNGLMLQGNMYAAI